MQIPHQGLKIWKKNHQNFDEIPLLMAIEMKSATNYRSSKKFPKINEINEKLLICVKSF